MDFLFAKLTPCRADSRQFLNNNNMWNLLKTIDKNDIAGLIICLSAIAFCAKIMYIIGNI
jgi:hypothetical protein